MQTVKDRISDSAPVAGFDAKELDRVDSYWKAANFLSVAQIFLRDNPLLREPLKPEHIKPRLLGHWGTCPGLNFVYAHLNRVIRQRDTSLLYIAGPGHGGAAPNACAYLDGAYNHVYSDYPQKAEGVKRLVQQFSWPGGSSSHASPFTPGSIHEGGELGYCLGHAYGAVLDNPDLVACCVIGDGEAETGALAASWHANKFLNPARDGAVLPILSLNEYKIAGPTVFSALTRPELTALFQGYGYEPVYVEVGAGENNVHSRMAKVLNASFDAISTIQAEARGRILEERPRWPMIVLRSPKGWTGPRELDGEPVEGSFRSHQVPLPDPAHERKHLEKLEKWMKAYEPRKLFDGEGGVAPIVSENLPRAERRMSLNPHANGGSLLRDLDLPRWEDSAIQVESPGSVEGNPSSATGEYLRDVMKANAGCFRLFSPDETMSNRLSAVLDVTDRAWFGPVREGDEDLGLNGRVMEVLSEHLCQGWLEGYLLTGRHGVFSSYEAFIHIIDSMLNQYAKWLKVSKETGWRKPVASLNYLLASHCWQQDHNGFTHQDPGFIDHVANKKADIARVYLPPDANTTLSVVDHCLKSRNYVNVIVAGKQDAPCWLDADAARQICKDGLDTFKWASVDAGEDPEIVLACAGDVPTLEVMAAASILREEAPDLRFRVVNVVDLLCLQSEEQHPHGKSDEIFDKHFTKDKPVLFVYHGYPWFIHRLTYKRTNHENIHVRGYVEEGGTTTPFDMRVVNRIDRFNLVADVARYLPDHPSAEALKRRAEESLSKHAEYVTGEGKDMPEITEWKWTSK